ncbi:hypothetical protein EV401DRAFT_1929509 [Pisolithus croceorrhizus]|nr:hypothetical protein EV401DRAFT_1929509 [Pisolithus croceorrhizus]
MLSAQRPAVPRANGQLRVDRKISRRLSGGERGRYWSRGGLVYVLAMHMSGRTRAQQTTRDTKLDVTTQLSPPRSTQVAVIVAVELLVLVRSAPSQNYCLSARKKLDRMPDLGEGSPGSEHLHGRCVYCCRDPSDNGAGMRWDGYCRPNADQHLKYPTSHRQMHPRAAQRHSNVTMSVHRVVQRGRPHRLRYMVTTSKRSLVSPRKGHHFVTSRS